MRNFSKPILVVSRCLEFDKCRYNGQMIPDRLVRSLQDHVRFLPICPEVEIGLGTPRTPIKILGNMKTEDVRLVQPSSGRDLTKLMNEFSKSYINGLGDVDGFLLKAASPSCGVKGVKVYPKMEPSSSLRNESGFFAREVRKAFPGLAIEDEGRLSNFRIREHFFNKIFCLADFRRVKKAQSMSKLVDFHSRNKFLLMSYNEKQMRLMGRATANADRLSISEVLENYQIHLFAALMRVARCTSQINVVMHIMGFFSKETKSSEKKYLLDLIDKYRNEKIPLSAILTVLSGWVARYDQNYLANQTFFEPYPEDLIAITDSGKGREGR